MSMSIAIPAMVNNTVLSSPANASRERPPTDSQDNQNETSKEFKAVVSLMRLQTFSLTQMVWCKGLFIEHLLCSKNYITQKHNMYLRRLYLYLVSVSVTRDHVRMKETDFTIQWTWILPLQWWKASQNKFYRFMSAFSFFLHIFFYYLAYDAFFFIGFLSLQALLFFNWSVKCVTGELVLGERVCWAYV